MSREIKFRAWVPSQERITSPQTLDELINRAVIRNQSLQDELIIMQYTGLKDKNGKEIYEGDILLFIDAEDTSTENGYDWSEIQLTGAIEWSDERMGWFLTNREAIEMEEIEFDEIEIIGNIYENQNLL